MKRELLEQLLARLDKVKQLGPDRWMACCPAHDDHNPSLSIKLANDRILLHCFAGCSYQDIIQALGIEPDPQEDPEDIYVYYDALGKPVFRKLRYPGKRFVIEHYENGFWVKGKGKARDLLYNLPQLLKTNKIYIVEGEKDAENLGRFGLVATTNPHGASELDLIKYAEFFKGKDVVIIPDKDEQGQALARRWVSTIFPLAKTIKIINLPGTAKDVSEFLAYHSFEEFFALEKETETFGLGTLQKLSAGSLIKLSLNVAELTLVRRKQDPRGYDYWSYEAKTKHDLVSGLVALNNLAARTREAAYLEEKLPTAVWSILFEEAARLAATQSIEVFTLSEVKVEPPSYLLKPFILREGINILFGPGGSLKSLFATVLAKCVINNWLPPGNHDLELAESGKVLYLDWEDDIGPFHDRAKRLGIDLRLLDYVKCRLPLAESLPQILPLVTNRRPVLVIIDSLGPALSGDAFRLETASDFVANLKLLEVPTLIIAHPPKRDQDSVYGSIFFENLARNIFVVELLLPESTKTCIELSNKKSSYFNGFALTYQASFEFNPLSIDVEIHRSSTPPKGLVPAIVYLLEQHGPLSIRELKESVLATEPSIRQVLLKLKLHKKVEQLPDGTWMLVKEDDVVPF